MPAGLDGNPNPITTRQRSDVIDEVVATIASAKVPERPLIVAIDGIDGAGKSTFADEVASAARGREMSIVRSTIDSFHNERSIRHARGPTSPLGFYADSHDLTALQHELLDPFKVGQGAEYRIAVFDEPTDSPTNSEIATVSANDVLIFDGIFLQRSELAAYWDIVVFLDAQKRVDLERLGLVLENLPPSPVDAVAHTLTWAARIDRYSSGMRHYIDLVDPAASARIVIDNNNIGAPVIVTNG